MGIGLNALYLHCLSHASWPFFLVPQVFMVFWSKSGIRGHESDEQDT